MEEIRNNFEIKIEKLKKKHSNANKNRQNEIDKYIKKLNDHIKVEFNENKINDDKFIQNIVANKMEEIQYNFEIKIEILKKRHYDTRFMRIAGFRQAEDEFKLAKKTEDEFKQAEDKYLKILNCLFKVACASDDYVGNNLTKSQAYLVVLAANKILTTKDEVLERDDEKEKEKLQKSLKLIEVIRKNNEKRETKSSKNEYDFLKEILDFLNREKFKEKFSLIRSSGSKNILIQNESEHCFNYILDENDYYGQFSFQKFRCRHSFDHSSQIPLFDYIKDRMFVVSLPRGLINGGPVGIYIQWDYKESRKEKSHTNVKDSYIGKLEYKRDDDSNLQN
ncbi:200_t:CDS:2 [Dentiscutata heterogama]|uniref:200_t:CDS:1 n=1 Tax=Dentiscutata heterogama TaxID=1316150 RepID=A0ACA9L844_9GLOM|nr:200_t:CDS:2 [Dentiscutata heterogama]